MFLPVELESGIKALQFDVCCEAIHQNFDCCYVLKKGYANLQFSTNANKKYSTENLVKSSLRATEKYAYCLGYLHFTSRYGFPKLNTMYHFYTKKWLKRNNRQEFLKCTQNWKEEPKCCEAIDRLRL